MKKTIGLGLLFTLLSSAVFSQTADPYMWLEDVDSERSMEFVNQHNTGSVDVLNKLPTYQPIYDKCLEIYNSTDRIVYPTTYGDFIYNFWQDKEHVRGIWRRSPKADYIAGNPKWEILMDIDAMSEADGVKWVYKGAAGLYPKYDRFLVSLSNGGGDAVVIKEFDVNKKAFVENGFTVEEAKGGVSYIDENTVIISTDFGPGSMTTSGYPSQAKVWKRGTALKDATLIYTGDINDVGAWGGVMRDGAKAYTIISRAITFYTSETYVWMDNKAVKLELPEDAESNGFINNQYIIALKSDWTVRGVTYKQGDLISLDFTELLKGVYQIQLIYRPDEFSSISGVSATKNKLLLELISNVNGELYVYTFSQNVWTKEKVKAPEYGKISVVDADEFSDKYYFNFANFLTPTTLYYADAASGDVKAIKSLPAYFDGSKFKVEQFKATSADGTLVPYFIVSSKTAANNGHNPTLLYAYGGFESSSLPFYSGTVGTAWLERGGVYVLANIRGGGEYGPKWHQAGLKEKRQNVYNDFHAVAEDLIKRKITAPEHLGIMGGSNGGLLMGVAFTQRPDLYKAVVCQVPLLDMERYNKLLAGASWMGEYGNPDIPEEWAFIKKYSPYHNLKENAAYPEVFFTTSTRDDRVHPGHARKMVAKMESMGYKVYYYENIEGGHAGASTNEQRAKSAALEYSYLWMKLKH
ncbi:MAG: prolyl oligopeptidase family serine peptidase [Chitinophagales bacterium]|jgi:prolyl oligopeptidase|nr:S9 family peptidase [Bacteroidota bacterium]MBK9504272.1 S9 family peptidase [Bacteroidota bacterium]MBK9557074.1 S9 family peptidase [Bacteroidota bacterium]MBP9880602.1 S9 family peptidase [Chitinophagales bacterium]